jgi:hypothetical protein
MIPFDATADSKVPLVVPPDTTTELPSIVPVANPPPSTCRPALT